MVGHVFRPDCQLSLLEALLLVEVIVHRVPQLRARLFYHFGARLALEVLSDHKQEPFQQHRGHFHASLLRTQMSQPTQDVGASNIHWQSRRARQEALHLNHPARKMK